MEHLNLKILNIIKGINESKILVKDISCKCRYGRVCNSGQKWNNVKKTINTLRMWSGLFLESYYMCLCMTKIVILKNSE